MALNDLQERFCEEYLVDYNAYQATMRAGYSPKNCTSQSARLMKNPDVQAYIAVRQAKTSRRLGIAQERILNEVAKVAFFNITDVVDEDGKLKEGVAREDTAAIACFKIKSSNLKNGSSVEREIKLADKLAALELLMKYLGMLDKKVEIGFKNELAVSVMDALNSAKEMARKLEERAKGVV
ncbi:MAG: terminase small subunit [Bacillota bacterium]